MVERVVGLPSLVSLHSYQSQHSPENIQVLTNRLHFNSLLIADAVVNDEITEKISQLRWLQHLKFQGTPLTPDQFHQFDALPLITVDLQNTGLTFRELESVEWSKSCELLWLSRQPDGVADSNEGRSTTLSTIETEAEVKRACRTSLMKFFIPCGR